MKHIHAGTTDEELGAPAAGYPPPPASLYRDALEMAWCEREAGRREASRPPPGVIEVHGT